MVHKYDLCYAYEDGTTLSSPDIRLAPGAHLPVIGPSGVGKTTLLYLSF